MSKTAFERYAPFIQEYIYRKGWADLREVQVEACEAILDGDQHVIIASGTASGKTEAAFFPILTLLHEQPPASVGVMYIGPLKALINDQFERLNELLEDSGIPVWPWHGDISATLKRKALRTARGILQMTPESLEALLMRHPEDARRLFSDLRFVVIDELHALMGADRGLQVLCLLARLEKLVGCSPRRIGLSATLNDYQPAMDFLSAGSGRGAVAVGIQNRRRTISLCAESFVLPGDEAMDAQVMREYNAFLYEHCHLKKCLIFTNSRNGAEKIIASMKAMARERHERDVFYVHHGSVSAALRQETEHALRDGDGPTVAAATLTLELGIDIGDLDSTIQLGAPYTCSSFVQRLGRSGRRTGKSQMMFVSLHSEEEEASLDALPWELLRAIAIIQLYLEERWVEPFAQKRKPFSLLAHQTLSALMAHGELSPAALAREVLTLPPFRGAITQDEYRELLRFMLQEDYLQRMESGGIIVGMKGERMTNHYSFYAVFQDEESYQVLSREGEIGTLTKCPAAGEIFSLAGRAWQVVTIDEQRRNIYVTYAQGSKAPNWSGGGGQVHARVVQRMKQVLEEDTVYPYLQPNAARVLAEARSYALSCGLLDAGAFPCGENSFMLMPWTGTREMETLFKLLSCGLREELLVQNVVDGRYYLRVKSGLSMEEFFQRLRRLEVNTDQPELVLLDNQAPSIDKYDGLVPPSLLRRAYLFNQMDADSAMEVLRAADPFGKDA